VKVQLKCCLQSFSLSLRPFRIVEVFSWLLEVANDTKEHWDGAKIHWSVSYVHDGPKAKDLSTEVNNPHEAHRKKLIAKLEIQKDDIQSVLPISKVR
jgi:transmembrane protein 132